MPLIDDRGRLFGRWNVIDAAVLGLVLLLIPVAYGASLLFRTPTPTVTAVEPAQVFAQDVFTVRIAGTNLRPFLSVRLGAFTGTMLVASPTTAEVRVTGLPAGTYDLVLLDEARELLRMPAALTVMPLSTPPATTMDMQAVGAFTYLTAADATLVRVGSRLVRTRSVSPTPAEQAASIADEPFADVLAVLAPEMSTQRVRLTDASVAVTPVPDRLQVPAIIRLRCAVTGDQCRVGDASIVRDAMLPVALPLSAAEKFTRPVTYLMFRIDELRPANAPLAFPSAIAPLRM